MRRACSVILSMGLIVLLFSSQALALDLYGFGSYWEKKDADGQWGAGAGLSIPLFTEHFKLDGRAYYFEKSTVGEDGEIRLIPFDLGLQLHLFPNGVLNPYALGGITYVYADSDRFDVDSDFGGYIGGGLEWAIPSSIVKIFGEALYRYNQIDVSDFDDLDVSGFTGNVGLKLNF